MRTRRGVLAALTLAAVLTGTTGSARTLVILGAGYGTTQEDNGFGPPGSLGLVVGVLHPLRETQQAVGVEASYQMLGISRDPCAQFQSVVPVTVQAYTPLSISSRQIAYATVGAGIYTRHWGVPRGCDYLHDGGRDDFQQVDSQESTAGGFNLGLGVKSRAPRGATAIGVDARFHAMYARGYTGLWTAGARLFF